jgi:hypothetical protein
LSEFLEYDKILIVMKTAHFLEGEMIMFSFVNNNNNNDRFNSTQKVIGRFRVTLEL